MTTPTTPTGGPDPASPPVVLVGFDDSDAGRCAVQAARDLARRIGATLKVVHAMAPIAPLATAPAGLPGHAYVPAPEDLEDQRRQTGDTMAEHAGQLLAGAEVPWTFDVVSGDAVTVLEEQADAVDAYVGLVGPRHAGIGTALDRLLTGSTSRALQRRCSRPVLVVPEPRERH